MPVRRHAPPPKLPASFIHLGQPTGLAASCPGCKQMAPNLAPAGSDRQEGHSGQAGPTPAPGSRSWGRPDTLQTRFFFPFGRHPACPFQSSSLLFTPRSPLPQAVPARPSRPTSLRQGLCSAGQKRTCRQDLPASPAFPPTHTGCPPAPLPTSNSPQPWARGHPCLPPPLHPSLEAGFQSQL